MSCMEWRFTQNEHESSPGRLRSHGGPRV
jgi:hypothetical protein